MNSGANWIEEVEQAINQTTIAGDDEIVNITKGKFTQKLVQKKNGQDKVMNYWLKAFTATHEGTSVAKTVLINNHKKYHPTIVRRKS